MTRTPIKPTKIATHVFKETCSLNIIADSATTNMVLGKLYYACQLKRDSGKIKQNIPTQQ